MKLCSYSAPHGQPSEPSKPQGAKADGVLQLLPENLLHVANHRDYRNTPRRMPTVYAIEMVALATVLSPSSAVQRNLVGELGIPGVIVRYMDFNDLHALRSLYGFVVIFYNFVVTKSIPI